MLSGRADVPGESQGGAGAHSLPGMHCPGQWGRLQPLLPSSKPRAPKKLPACSCPRTAASERQEFTLLLGADHIARENLLLLCMVHHHSNCSRIKATWQDERAINQRL